MCIVHYIRKKELFTTRYSNIEETRKKRNHVIYILKENGI